MKKIFRILFLLMISITFLSCATTSSDTGVSDAVSAPEEKSSNTENRRKEEKLRFNDWKYRGFGKELPDWVEPAIDNKINVLKKTVPELSSASAIKILKGTGDNSDQAEQSVKVLVEELKNEDSEFIKYDNFWVLENKNTLDMPYISVYVYYKN